MHGRRSLTPDVAPDSDPSTSPYCQAPGTEWRKGSLVHHYVPHVRQHFNWCVSVDGCCECGGVPGRCQPVTDEGRMLHGAFEMPASLGGDCRDCGLACVLMVLRAVGWHTYDYTALRSLCDTTRYG